MRRTRILVIGAGSFVGRRIVAALAASDWAMPLADAGLNALPADLGGAVFAPAASPGAIARATRTWYPLLDGGDRTLRVVHLSSMTVYGASAGVLREDSALAQAPAPYPAAHLDAERQARGASANLVVLRPGGEYGPDCEAWSGRFARWLKAGRIGDLGADGDGVCNLIFIDDLVTAVLRALQAPALAGATFNLAMAAPPSWNEYLIAYAIALDAVPVRRMTPLRWRIETKLLAPPLKILELVAGRVRLATVIPPALPPSLRRLTSADLTLDSSQAETRLQMQWTPLAVGLAAAADAYR
jgi:2-alkyl-3-oxoalkanoate reductase